MSKKVYKTSRKYPCPFCEAKLPRMELIDHVEKEHEALIPENYTATRVVYDSINHTDHGTCMICKKPVYTWNEKASRYDNICSEKCRKEVRRIALERHIKVYNSPTLLTDPEHQEKMLANRHISGTYKHSDGASITYTGKYEKATLEFMDKVMNIPSKDIQMPGPILEYEYNGETHSWITDIYYIPANLIIEVKDGGNNPNNRNMPEYRGKQQAKEIMITELGKFNYLRLTNNNFSQLLEALAEIKYENMDRKDATEVSMHYFINESSLLNERYLFNKEDIYYNKDKFDSGEINLCFIVGHSGSGKSTMSKSMKDSKINICELDVVNSNFALDDDKLKEESPIIYNFFKSTGSKYRYKSWEDLAKKLNLGDNNDNISYDNPKLINYMKSSSCAFVDYIINYAKSHKNEKFVVEGISIFQYVDPEKLKDFAVYIKGTSALISFIRSTKRESKKTGEIYPIKLIGRMLDYRNWKNYYLDENSIRKYVKYFSSKMNESFIHEEVGGLPPRRATSTWIEPYILDGHWDLSIGNDHSDTVLVKDTDGNIKGIIKKEYMKEYSRPGEALVYDGDDSTDIFNKLLKGQMSFTEALETVAGYRFRTLDELALRPNWKYVNYKSINEQNEFLSLGIIRENEILSGEVRVFENETPIKGAVILARSVNGYFIHTPKDHYLSSNYYETPEDIPQNVIDNMADLYNQLKVI